MTTARRILLQRGAAVAAALAAAGLLPARAQSVWNQAAFDARSPVDVWRALGATGPVESSEVVLTAPDIAENGAAVPVAARSSLPGVLRLVFMVENNPTTLTALFEIAAAVEPAVSLRIKMAESSRVIAAAVLADGRVLYAQKDVKVTLGGCG